MIKRDEMRGPSCLTNAHDDEPIFVLRATDELAPTIVRQWALQYKAQKQALVGGWSERQRAKFEEALALADLMAIWYQSHGAQEPKRPVRGYLGSTPWGEIDDSP